MTKPSPAVCRAVLLGLLLLGLAVPASAHAAAPPASYLTRVLADYNDDWLGVQDGHDLVALDAYAAYDVASGGDSLVLRLILSGGYAQVGSANPELSESITFTAGGQAHEVTVSTSDNVAFTATGATLRGPFPQLTADGEPDGARFYVEALVPFSALGVQAGDAATGFFVTGRAGETDADLMPQGAAPGYPDPLGTGFAIDSYTLPSPAGFVTVAVADAEPVVPAAGELQLEVDLTNLVPDTAQTVTVSLQGDGVLAGFAAGPSATSANASIDLAAGGAETTTLFLAREHHEETDAQGHGHGNATAPAHAANQLTIEVWTDLGGHQVLTVSLHVEQPAPAASNATEAGHDDHDHGHEEEKDAPGVGIAAFVAAIAVAVALRRRA
jgi:hypothetical protein